MSPASVVPRRPILTTAAWTVPVVVTGAAAPLAAASCAMVAIDYPSPTGAGGNGTWTSNVPSSGTSATQGLGTFTLTGQPSPAFTVTATYFGVNEHNANLFRIMENQVGGLGTENNAPRLQMEGGVGSANRVEFTYTWPSPITNLSFVITDIDFGDKEWVTISPTPSSTVKAAGVSGDGSTMPWQGPNPDLDNVFSGNGNVRVTYAGPISQFTVSFYNGASPRQNGSIYVADMSYKTC